MLLEAKQKNGCAGRLPGNWNALQDCLDLVIRRETQINLLSHPLMRN